MISERSRILPAGSFSSVDPFSDKKQSKWAASYHGFMSELVFRSLSRVAEGRTGRWRGEDPAVVQYERLKQLRKGDGNA